MDDVDVVVIGAGFGGLSAALSAAQQGARVAVFEALKYPGGCASTFTKDGIQYEAGATLFSGLGPGQLFDRWRQEHGMDVHFDLLDVPIEFRTPDLTLPVSSDRDTLIETFCSLPGAPVAKLRAFFAEQHRVAEALWPIFTDPRRLPPLSWSAVGWHLRRAWRYLPLLRVVGRPLSHVLRRHGLLSWAPLVSYLDAICQITVQAGVREAEAPFAMATMDYCARGTGHVRGGIGALAWGMVRAIEALGGQVHLSRRVKAVRADGGAWVVSARRQQAARAPVVLSNLLPRATQGLLGAPHPRLAALSAQMAEGWGAAMLYLTVRADAAGGDAPHHLELVADPGAPLTEGNHVFCSISGAQEVARAPAGLRTVTVSTHVPMPTLRALQQSDRGAYVARVQQAMRDTIAARAPALWDGVVSELTASPRTWARFTRRPEGLVGGIPRRAGWHNYQGLLPRPLAPGLFLVGDSVFPGQSTLAAALGGVRTATAALSGRRLIA